MEHSVSTLEAKANVCCVKFNPESRYHLAFGSAGNDMIYNDSRFDHFDYIVSTAKLLLEISFFHEKAT